MVRYERAAPGELIHIDIKKLGRFDRHRPPHHRRPRAARAEAAASAGTSSMSRSTTPRASPTPRSCPTRKGERLRLPRPGASPASPASASRVARVMTDNGSPNAATPSATLCRDLGAPPHPHPALHAAAPTARPSASSRPRSANGPTPAPTTPRRANPSHDPLDRRLQHSTTPLSPRQPNSMAQAEQPSWKRSRRIARPPRPRPGNPRRRSKDFLANDDHQITEKSSLATCSAIPGERYSNPTCSTVISFLLTMYLKGTAFPVVKGLFGQGHKNTG